MRDARALCIGGTVQGVGFRPWAAREAEARSLVGRIRNTPRGVVVRLEGEACAIASWLDALATRPPPGARITSVRTRRVACRNPPGFVIEPSSTRVSPTTAAVPPDAGICAACTEELFDPTSRRHRYAFTHCAECGPRASILTGLPFDRARTTLTTMPPCGACRAEYDAPGDRRFHAETITCPACGPRLRAFDAAGIDAGGDPIERAAAVIARGGIVALEGFGAHHLLVDPTRPGAVARLRERKGRPSKPFALLASDLGTARRLVRLDDDDEALLASAMRPILIAPRRSDRDDGVAPSLRDLGIMLPSAPAQLLLLFGPGNRPGQGVARFPFLVCTSANRSGEPALGDEAEAVAALRALADLVLTHDRPIARASDDSVFRTSARGALPIRLSRGAAPKSFALPAGLVAREPILALGGDLKCAPAVAFGRELRLLEHVGDLASVASLDLLERRIAGEARRLGRAIARVAHDRHPGYAGTQLAARLAPDSLAVLHHHAHALACLLEHDRVGPALALVLDGGGFGADATVWGGELLEVDAIACRRLAGLEPVWLVGGDTAARQPWRSAMSWLDLAFEGAPPRLPLHARRRPGEGEAIARLLAERRHGIPTSSCGRLFDAVACVLDLVDESTHEAEAAAALESLAASASRADEPLERLGPSADPSTPIRIADAFRLLIARVAAGADRAGLALGFHAVLARRLVDAVASARAPGLPIVLSGGCFVNRILLDRVVAGLETRGFEVLIHRALPCNDGGLAAGQAIAAVASAASIAPLASA